MVNIINNSGHVAYGLKEFVIDEISDLEDLPIDIPAGSIAFCIEDTSVYMLNSLGKWKELF